MQRNLLVHTFPARCVGVSMQRHSWAPALACLLALSVLGPDPASLASAEQQPTDGSGKQQADAELERLSRLLSAHRNASLSERQALAPKMAEALGNYRKQWLGNRERQLLYESVFKEIAGWVLDGSGASGARTLAESVHTDASLRMAYLLDPDLIDRRVQRVKLLLDVKEYETCAAEAESAVRGYHGNVYGVELALGLCYAELGRALDAIHVFERVIDHCQLKRPEDAARAALLAGRTFIHIKDYKSALGMYEALVTDYPQFQKDAQVTQVRAILKEILALSTDL